MTTSSICRPIVFSALTCVFCFGQSDATNVTALDPDRETLLSLPWKQFDQTPNSGWRVYLNPSRKQYLKAAKLIEDYLQRHDDLSARQRALCHYHAAHQYIYRAVRGGEGDVREAFPHLDKAIVSGKDPAPSADWSDMVIATKAFLAAIVTHYSTREIELRRYRARRSNGLAMLTICSRISGSPMVRGFPKRVRRNRPNKAPPTLGEKRPLDRSIPCFIFPA
jgi:hypothetical protein